MEFSLFNLGTFLIMVVNLSGTVLNSRQKISGFYIWGVCNILWACVNFSHGIFWQGVQNLIFLALNVYGLLCWRYTAEVVDQKLKKLFRCGSCSNKK